MQWADLDPLTKNHNGDNTDRGGLMMMLGAMANPGVAPDPDAAGRIEQYLVDLFRKNDKCLYVTFDVDYHPGRELVELSNACGLQAVAWPIKSRLCVQDGHNKYGTVTNRQGYRATPETFVLCPEQEGWVITEGLDLHDSIHDIVAPAAQAGHRVGTWEPFAPEATPAG